MDKRQINILLIEDDPEDAEYLDELLAGDETLVFKTERAMRLESGLTRVLQGNLDVVLLDLGLPDSVGLDTFIRFHAAAPDVPVVVLTGLNDEQMAILAVSKGAQDYLPKQGLDSRLLVRAIRYALERQKLLQELKEALTSVKTLRGLLPICAHCKKIRDDKGYWNQIESYIRTHSEADFSHGICPECVKKDYPDLYQEGEFI
ncbi:MAG: response regulator [Deltaproteobacteria bacterium]|nr:response regulator [Deltaproteobacteria bacterium]